MHTTTTPPTQAIHEATTAFLNTLPTTPTGAIRDVYADFNTLTLRVVLQSLFGASMQAHESHSITSMCVVWCMCGGVNSISSMCVGVVESDRKNACTNTPM